MIGIEVKGAIDPATKKYIINASSNPAVLFGSANPSLFNRLFVSKSKFEIKNVKGGKDK